ncbi:MAG TPA: DUF885 domain-containing protein [Casimicrobiaceae bacterium]|nr:DUF885 domain-containing protein [Casimicrobiaceae bacterium]
MRKPFLQLLLLSSACLALSAGVSAAEPGWITESNKNAQVLLEVIARFAPEQAGRLGVDGLDDRIQDLDKDVYARSMAATQQAVVELRKRLAQAGDTRVRQDLEILIDVGERNLRSSELQHQYMLPYYDIAQTEFYGIRSLIDPQVPKGRQAAALERLKRYAGIAPGTQPLTRLAEERTAERFGDAGLVGPYVEEVKQNLAKTKTYVDGIKQLFASSGLQGWEEPYAQLARQLSDYDDWVKTNILPRARADNRLPEPIYADDLRQAGVDIAPARLMAMAQFSFGEIQHQMEALAPLVAKQKGYPSSDYRDVIRELKKQQIEGDAILPFYRKRIAEIEDIIRKQHIVTLPERPVRIRLASAAETAAVPAPHMRPPRLIGNTGEYGEFVLPLSLPAADGKPALKFDDFTFDAAAWAMTAHEARPGHELQFASMIERGVSIARAVFAFNSVNAEGWALYSEAEMQPYEPLDGQLITLQLRLLRAVRAFIDPMLNLGILKPDAARSFLEREVVLSPALADEEVQRFTFMAPGQATSYYYGYMRLMQLRAETQVKLGRSFDRQKFNDFILSQGVLPPELMQKAVEEEFIARQQ